MPDISMCIAQTCPSKDKCYRFRAIPNPYRQSYTLFKPDEGKMKCDNFIGLLKKDKLTPTKDDKI